MTNVMGWGWPGTPILAKKDTPVTRSVPVGLAKAKAKAKRIPSPTSALLWVLVGVLVVKAMR